MTCTAVQTISGINTMLKEDNFSKKNAREVKLGSCEGAWHTEHNGIIFATYPTYSLNLANVLYGVVIFARLRAFGEDSVSGQYSMGPALSNYCAGTKSLFGIETKNKNRLGCHTLHNVGS